uniref:Poly [ADP-ribose] polymerase n=1 Tax=Guillardia theta TaxID=55529 RepID=A0A7S4KI53_GUITH
MLHGVPGDCPKCQGRLQYSDGMYKCTTWTEDGFAKCQYSSITGERKAFKMPKDMGHDYLDNFKFVKVAIPKAVIREQEEVRESVQEREKQRLMKAEEELAVINAKRRQEEASDPSTCLKDMVFMLHSTKNYRIDFDEWSGKIKSAGGSIVKSMTKSVTHVLTTSGAHTAGGSAIKEAVKRKLPVVKLEFVEACISSGKRLTEQPYLLSGEATEDPEKKKKSSQSKTVKIMVKGKGAVDVESGLADNSHILEVRDNVYSATLNRTDISEGLNSYYVLQIIESDDSKTTHLFRKWGRIGVESKGTKLEKMHKDSCIHEFEKLFQEKTGNPWQDRTPDRFTQQPGRFAIMEIGIAAADEHGSQLQKDTSSKLPPTVASLIQLIFDIDMMRKSMLEMEIDLDKMPLGALSRKQIQRGYSVLTEIQNVLDDPNLDEFDRNQKILSCTNQFYTIVPQNFGLGGMTAVHRIDSHDKLKEKLELVESLLEMEIAVSLQKEGGGDESAIDANYKRLKTDIKPIAKDDERWKMIDQYLRNTHAATHSTYTTELMDLFEIEREGEKDRFAPFAKDSNRKLLWHGSRITNWVGILSQGLRIAPPEAPVTGYMFGKGVYFADMSSKSANYCKAELSNNEGLLMLSEVALGKSHELMAAKETLPKGLPKDCISVKGCGKTAPDPKASFIDEDGVEVPCGKGTQMYGLKSSLLYNEYIVYNVSQIKNKYLLRVKFNTNKR